jgi:methyltransferase family protein
MSFFDEYPRFYETSHIGSDPNRLNTRYQALIEANLDCIRNCSILDLGSHDGRWSFAALKAGADRILGIEARSDFHTRAIETFQSYSIPEDRFSFLLGDVFKRLPEVPPGSIDTVFCFGILYCTSYHQLLLELIANLKPKTLILDTFISTLSDPVIELRVVETKGDILASSSGAMLRTILLGYPSRAALELMLKNAGFYFRYFDWQGASLEDWTSLKDYQGGTRVTLRAELN